MFCYFNFIFIFICYMLSYMFRENVTSLKTLSKDNTHKKAAAFAEMRLMKKIGMLTQRKSKPV